MELAVRLPWMQREDVSDLSHELMLSGTPTLPQRTMGKESGWEFEEGGIRWWWWWWCAERRRRNIGEEI